MSTKYTREQIDKARQLADYAFSETAHRNRQHDGDIVAGTMRRPGDEWIDTFTEALGLDVEDEKPEPGTWHITENGSPARVNWNGSLHAYYPDGEFDIRHDDSDWPSLTPARVVSEDEWAELTTKAESQADEIQLLRQSRDKWAELARKAEQEAKAVARRKMGAKAEVTRAQVMDAYTDGTLAVSHADTRAIDRIMELLAASK